MAATMEAPRRPLMEAPPLAFQLSATMGPPIRAKPAAKPRVKRKKDEPINRNTQIFNWDAIVAMEASLAEWPELHPVRLAEEMDDEYTPMYSRAAVRQMLAAPH